MAEINPTYGDKEIVTDILTSQKHITGMYNTASNECVSQSLKNEFMAILSDEHRLQGEVFTEMQKRGWYPTEMADQTKIHQALTQFQGTDS